jgi:hypothetical protein
VTGRRFKLARACACYWIMLVITSPFERFMPRCRLRARIVNTLSAPFFPYGAYWALRKNPNAREIIAKVESGHGG